MARTRCRRCGGIASTNYPCKVCGSRRHVLHDDRDSVFFSYAMPPGFVVSEVNHDCEDEEVWVCVDGPRQPDAYHDDEDRTFPGGLSLYVKGDDPQADLVVMHTAWALHEALEFVAPNDDPGNRLADPHPRPQASEDEMWTWLRDELTRLLSEYRDRWPVRREDERT